MNLKKIDIRCVICKTPHSVLVPGAGYKLWASGQKHIQDALPMLSANERELLMSGICPHCFDKLFREED